MAYLRSFAALAAPSIVACLLLFTSPAAAEAGLAPPPPPSCKVTLLPRGADVPANLPALVVFDESNPGATATWSVLRVEGPSTVKLARAVDPAGGGTTLLVPDEGAIKRSGAYSVHYKVDCSSGKAEELTASFTTRDPVPLPTVIGKRIDRVGDTLGTALLAASPELAAHLRTTRFEVLVDGVSHGKTRYGASESGTLRLSVTSSGAFFDGTRPDAPRPAPCASKIGIERHVFELRAHVAGASADPEPFTGSIDIDCRPAPVDDSSDPPDAGAGAIDGLGGSGASVGCRVRPTRPGPGLASVGVVFALCLALSTIGRRLRKG